MDRSPRTDALAKLLDTFARIGIVGGPRTGKTMLGSQVLDRPVICTDQFRHVGWPDVPLAVIAHCDPIQSFVVEGVQVARALRAGLQVDAVLYLDTPQAEQTKAQRAMGKGIATVFADWRARNLSTFVVSPDLP